jgi:tetratricopeptide (TPR) repeat protein
MADDEGKEGRAASPAAAAESIALGGDAALGRLDPRAAAYLEKQSALTDLQIEDLKRDDALRHWSLVVRHISDVLKLSFELALALVVAGVVLIIGAAIRSAATDNGVVIEAFSVPPDMAAKGLTGDVVATKVLDRLTAMQAQTSSRRAASSYANNWDKNIKVQIPDTGVSIGELDTYLHDWLGNRTHITGEIYHTAKGVSVTARAGGDASPTFTGTESDLDALIQQAAESVYRSTQPYRYAIWLEAHNRTSDASVMLQNLARSGSAEERAWAYVGLGNELQEKGDVAGSVAMLRQAIATRPDLLLAYENLAGDMNTLQHEEESVDVIKEAVALAARGGGADINPSDVAIESLLDRQDLAQAMGDNLAALDLDRQIESAPDRNSWASAYTTDLEACGALHDPDCVRRILAQIPPSSDPNAPIQRSAAMLQADISMGHWQAAKDGAPHLVVLLAKVGKIGAFFVTRAVNPLLALADAGLGDFRASHQTIDKTPLDCALCLRVRGRIDTLERHWAGANFWLGRAVTAAPSIPSGYVDWGAMLLARGDPDGAIATFALAHDKGPHFADPLEMWGEALMVKNRSDLALAKFEEACRYAPHWGRLHLKWGEALVYAGKADEAKKQFAIAAPLDLLQADRTALARWTGGLR